MSAPQATSVDLDWVALLGDDYPWLAGLGRLFAKIDATGDCWLWTASVNHRGYGKYWHLGQCVQAHRAVYEVLVGPIPAGLVLDHRCMVRACVNPDHLEPVTQRANLLRVKGNRVADRMRAAL